ncbi:WhiB family transcriptional regulator [Nocardia brasiliensis]|uniref:WhiB family transcriptional regulator n=1 Tax=Nocardia brasiliensis TaxID=37326 RepID=UPI003406E671
MNALDSAYNPARACDSGDPDAFFPSAGDADAVRYAQRLCLGCPILGQCALDAIPQVRERKVADCVIAAVHLPSEEVLRGEYTRERVVAQLRVVVQAAPNVKRGAA